MFGLTMKKVFKAGTTVFNVFLVIIILLVAGLNLLSRADANPWGLRTFVISSGSMAETIPAGSLIFVQPQEEYFTDEVITYYSGGQSGEPTTHRITEVSEGENLGYRTKGDANEDPDLFITPANKVVGKVVFNVPYFGKFADIATSKNGLIFLVIIPGSILAYSEITNIYKEAGRMIKKRKEKKNE